MIQIAVGQAIGPYQAMGFLGRGAFAQVFLAEGPQGSPCALKIGDDVGGGRFIPRSKQITAERDPAWISPDEAPAEAFFLDPHEGAHSEVLESAEVDALLLAEAEMLRAADGRGVVRLRDVIENRGRPVLVLDVVSGRTLRERIRSLEGVKLRWIAEAARTVERLTNSGAWSCHGDLKPENIVITEDEEVVLLDPVPDAARPDLLVTTPHYNPFLRRTAKADAESFAILLYELLCGALPFEHSPWEYAGVDPACHPAEDLKLSRSYLLSYPKPRDLNPHAPAEIERAIYRALCHDNYGLSEIRCDLEDFLLRR